MCKIRYVKQPHTYTCGPTAILNALKFCGHRATIRNNYNRLVKQCKSKQDHGTGRTKWAKVLRKYLSFKRVNNPTYKGIVNHLRNNGAVVLNTKYYSYKDHGWVGHYSFIIGATKKYIKMVNEFSNGKAVEYVNKRKFRYLLTKPSKRSKWTISWFIYKDL